MALKLSEKQVKELNEYLMGDIYCPLWVEEYAAERWADIIPYGVQTGDTGTLDEWLAAHETLLTDEFSDYLGDE